LEPDGGYTNITARKMNVKNRSMTSVSAELDLRKQLARAGKPVRDEEARHRADRSPSDPSVMHESACAICMIATDRSAALCWNCPILRCSLLVRGLGPELEQESASRNKFAEALT
jgi:hypothetical protein